MSARIDEDEILYLRRDDVDALLVTLDLVEVVTGAIVARAEGRTALPPESYLAWRTPGGASARSLAMPGAVDGAVGTKVINANPANVRAGLPRSDGLMLLFDPETARVRAILAASPISAARTAAVTLVAARALARRPIGRLALIGAGEIAAAHLDLLVRRLPDVDAIAVFDIDEARADALLDEQGEVLRRNDVDAARATDAREAIEGSTLIVTATTVDRGYIEAGWLSPGALVAHVSLDDLLPEAALAADLIYVDDWELVRTDERRLFGRLAHAGALVGRDALPAGGALPARGVHPITGTLGELLTGRVPGRTSPSQVVVFNPFGMAITDVAMATAVLRAAERRGIGLALRR